MPEYTEAEVLSGDILVAVTTDGNGGVTVFAPLAGFEPHVLTAPEDGEGEERFTEEVLASVREMLERMFIPGK